MLSAVAPLTPGYQIVLHFISNLKLGLSPMLARKRNVSPDALTTLIECTPLGRETLCETYRCPMATIRSPGQ